VNVGRQTAESYGGYPEIQSLVVGYCDDTQKVCDNIFCVGPITDANLSF
jgi:hypothetical protein